LMVIAAATVGALFSSDAWNNITFIAGEVKNPRRNLPASLALGVVFVITLYLLANLAYLAALPVRGNELDILQKTASLKNVEQQEAYTKFTIKRLEARIADAKWRLAQMKAKADNAAPKEPAAKAPPNQVPAPKKDGKDDAAEPEAKAPQNQPPVDKKDDKGAGKEVEPQGEPGKAPIQKKIDKVVPKKFQNKQLPPSEALIKKLEDSIPIQKKSLESTAALIMQLRGELAVARGIDHAVDDRVGTAVLEAATPGFGVPFMAIAIMISTFGCVNGLVLMGPRLYYAMAQDRLFFQSVGHLNTRGVPAAGLALQGLWSVVLIFSGTYSDLLDYIIFAALLFYVMTVAGLFILRRKRPSAQRPYKALGYPVIPAVYIALCSFIMLDLLVVKPVYSWPSFLIVLAGIPVFYLWRRPQANAEDV
jgi:amino acid transporter